MGRKTMMGVGSVVCVSVPVLVSCESKANGSVVVDRIGGREALRAISPGEDLRKAPF